MLMNAWNLLWIVPLAAVVGFVAAVICTAARED